MLASDEKTGLGAILPTKQHRAQEWLQFVNLVEVNWKVMNPQVKILACRSDNAGEFKSTAFEDNLLSEGIGHLFAPAGTHEHNSVAERKFRTLAAVARTLMLTADIDHSYWPLPHLGMHSLYTALQKVACVV